MIDPLILQVVNFTDGFLPNWAFVQPFPLEQESKTIIGCGHNPICLRGLVIQFVPDREKELRENAKLLEKAVLVKM